MDGARFDHLTRSLARGTSRRGLLKGLAAGLIGGVAGLRGTATDAQRAPGQANGAPCTRATDCGSFLCVGGVCCATACDGQCESCATGVCQPVTGAPEPGRAPCPGDGPCAATCDGITTSHCAAAPNSETVCGASTCANGMQTTYACGGNGACVPTTTACAPYGCTADGTACATSCEADDDCGPGSHCDAPHCLPDEGIGDPCDEESDCQSGVCVDTVCCVERCDACQVCNLAGNEGFCGPAPDGGTCGADGAGRCCEGGCVDVATDVEHCGGCDQSCLGVPNGVAVCQQGDCAIQCLPGLVQCTDDGPCVVCCAPADCDPPADPCQVTTCTDGLCGVEAADSATVCRAASCADGAAVLPATCDGATTCPAEERIECGLLTCTDDATACRESCTEATHCIVGTHCDSGDCVPDEGLGDPCLTTPPDCVSGVCVGGICCAQECAAPENGAASCSDDGLRCGFTCTGDFQVCGERCIPTDICCTVANCVPDPTQCQGMATACTDGACSFGPADDDASCGDDRVCCGGVCCEADQECTAGVCTVSCPVCQVYDAQEGACVTDPVTNFGPCPDFPCVTGGGFCFEGVCTPGGPPLEQGAICRPDACSQGTCFGSECRNVGPLTCHHLDTDCRVGVCDPVSGCHSVNRENGIDCPPTRSCAASSTCLNGACFSTGMAEDFTRCDRDACNVNGICGGGVCQFTEPLDCGPCQTCQDGACVPGNEGGACQENCFPGACQGGDCFIVIFPDQRACPICQTCQNETCVADPARENQTCVSEGHICCGGDCVSSTTTDHCGACASSCSDSLDACVDGACCRPPGSACAEHDECCEGEFGLPGQCFGGFCGGGGATCFGDGVCASGSCCGNSCCPVDSTCILGADVCVPCLPLQAECNPNVNLCCQDQGDAPCALSNISSDFDDFHCCHPLGERCTGSEDCCVVYARVGDESFPLFVGCSNGVCGGKGLECSPFLIWDPRCATGLCCDTRCCGDGEICVDGACVAGVCKSLGEVCDPTIEECCQDGEETICATIPGVAGGICRHPAGGSCDSNSDCADFLNCSPDGVCGAAGAPCESNADCGGAVCCAVCCRPGDLCAVGDEGGECAPATCREEGESCNPDPNFDDCCGNELACSSDGVCREVNLSCDEQGLVDCDGECCEYCCERVAYPNVIHDCCSRPCVSSPLGSICGG